jgi:hypothetical protein
MVLFTLIDLGLNATLWSIKKTYNMIYCMIYEDEETIRKREMEQLKRRIDLLESLLEDKKLVK